MLQVIRRLLTRPEYFRLERELAGLDFHQGEQCALQGTHNNTVERSIRGLALNRKNALFAGHDLGAGNWATIASFIETCKLNQINPLAWMTDTLTKLVNLWPASRIDELMPWAYAAA